MVLLESFALPHNAQFAQAALESAGIPCFLDNLHIVSTNWLWANMVGGVQLKVHASQLDEAKSVLASFEFFSDESDGTVDSQWNEAGSDPESDTDKPAK